MGSCLAHSLTRYCRNGNKPGVSIKGEVMNQAALQIVEDETPLLNAADYARIERAIVYLNREFRNQPTLEQIAEHVNLSAPHFNRLFRRWAGITPKQFVQRLTLDAAKSELAQAHSVMRAALEAGLSGPGRLHDLFVNLEAMTPGEFKAGGAGVQLSYGVAETPFGPATLVWNERGVSYLDFLRAEDRGHRFATLRAQWPKARWQLDERGAVDQMASLWRWSEQPMQPLRLLVAGTNFQVQVWRALLKLGTHGFTHYGALAGTLGLPNAARAIGNAVGANPIPWLIPCHRVLRANGGLGGYSGGLERKQAMLAYEYARRASG